MILESSDLEQRLCTRAFESVNVQAIVVTASPRTAVPSLSDYQRLDLTLSLRWLHEGF